MNLGAIAMWLVLIGILVLEIWGFVDMPANASANAILISIFRDVFWVFAWIAAFNGNHFVRKVMGGLLLLGAVLWLANATDVNPGVSVSRAYAGTAICAVGGLSLLFLPQLRQYVTLRSERVADDSASAD